MNVSERNEINRIDAQPIKNSGRGLIKGDAAWKIFVIDIKERTKSMSISRETWGKVCTDALKHGPDKFPALLLVLGESSQKTRLAVIEWSLLEELVESYVTSTSSK